MCVARNAIDFYLFFLPFSVTGYAIFFVHPDGESDFSRFSFSFFFVWKRWGKDEERKGRSVMILALLSYRGGGGVANWIRRYTCFKIETRISFSRIIIKEEQDFQTYFQQMENKEQGGEGAGIYVQLSSRSFEFLLFGQFFRFRSSLRWERRLSFSLTESKVSRVRCKRASG